MKIANKNRSHIALLLYSCLVLATFACCLSQAAHLNAGGKMSVIGVFCSLGGSDLNQLIEVDSGQLPVSGSSISSFSCPLCSVGVGVLNLTLLFGLLVLLLLGAPARRPLPEQDASILPRHAWPALNPRASP